MYIQPVIPLSLTKDLNLIARWVQPWITQYDVTEEGQKQNGLADAVVSTFIGSINAKNGFTWGAGPVLLMPVAIHDLLASKQFG
jgi:hypothetical protein